MATIKSITRKEKPAFSTIVAVSGGFDPVHIGHLRMFDDAKLLGGPNGWLVVILNCDDWLVRKKGRAFMNENERAELILGFASVDEVCILQTESNDVTEALKAIQPAIFANGGDRKEHNTPESTVCEELGIQQVYNVGGGKIQSSSWLHEKYHQL